MELLKTKVLREGKHVDFVAKRYRRADGTEVEREIVEHPGSVAVLAHDGEFAYLVAQPREAVEEDELLEIPAGTLDVEGESELECAQRELAEEAELRAESWSLLRSGRALGQPQPSLTPWQPDAADTVIWRVGAVGRSF